MADRRRQGLRPGLVHSGSVALSAAQPSLEGWDPVSSTALHTFSWASVCRVIPPFVILKKNGDSKLSPSMCVTVYFCFQPAHTDFTPLHRPALITEHDVDPVKYLSCALQQWHCRKCLVTLLSLALVNIYLIFWTFFCSQTVKPSEFPMTTDTNTQKKKEQRELPLCSSTVRRHVPAAVTQGDATCLWNRAGSVCPVQGDPTPPNMEPGHSESETLQL